MCVTRRVEQKGEEHDSGVALPEFGSWLNVEWKTERMSDLAVHNMPVEVAEKVQNAPDEAEMG